MTVTTHHDDMAIEDPQITEQIERLKRKMQDVADAFEATKTPAQRKKSKRKAQNVTRKSSRFKSAALLVLFLSMGLGIAYMVNMQLDMTVVEEPVIQEPEPVAAPLPAQLILKSASYELLNSELGNTLEITISVENTGDLKGTPTQFIIELVDADGASLMKWPMQVDGQPIDGKQTRSFVTRLIQPPAAFANIQVSMSK